ncbi:kinesin light chain [Colletotrichum spaethianum]|uniref:Kinesin light chain n=1 Tax=Colletotrichum spaethianum TaxID=700344 RepID=A0AA37PH35_9PEZI|nr:kinesin light chain [Colletotrichum spaethianum]GKT52029.1 kinesin light chain [Colletotrichum spaethianum]
MAKSVPARDFTVGWVCALPIELAAAAEMMDEEFADLPSQPSDTNIYSFGRIGVHNVVAACLPAGQMGTNQAATVASQMRTSFPSLRFGVLVGIGGGVPDLNDDIDIRLGDVVISQPSGQHGGVIQYDFGKTGAGGRVARTGNLNAPPTVLLNALAKLRSNDLRRKTQVLTHLSQLSGQPEFASPGPDNDILYDASSAHIGRAICAKCRPEDVVDRDARATTKPILFIGNIASGNQVMKDGQTRDRYSQELGGVLCFEMEAAGLMNNFPCIVIRGICDYADAHKNKRWQPYAAATAAAYAKELLCIIPPLVSSNLDSSENSCPKPHFVVPFGRNENFVGRDETLTQLLKRIPPNINKDACQRTAVVGLGGIGKTQVAIEAAYRVRDAHPDCSVFWVPAVSTAMFENAYREIGRTLHIRDIEDEQADVKSLVKAGLERDDVGCWLLIVDNADDMELLFTGPKLTTYLPSSRNGSILLTTRNHQAAAKFSRGHPMRLTEMGATEATQLLCTGLDEGQMGDKESTKQLLNHLTSLPLAIRQASAYMASNKNVTVSKYLGYCKASDNKLVKLLSKDFDDQDRYEDIRNPVATTWLISFDHVSRDNPLAARYLSFMCYLAEKDIPRALLPPAEDGMDTDDEMDTNEAISTLIAYAFILQRDAVDRFDIHRLVRLVMRNWLREQGKEEEQVTETIYWLCERFPWPNHRNRDVWMAYLPHTQAALQVRDWCTDDEALWDLLSRAGESNNLLGRYGEAEQMYRQTLELRKKVLGPENPSTLASMNNLAEALRKQGKYDEAEQMHRQTLELSVKVLGPENPSTLSSMNNLALVLESQGKYDEAEQMHRQELELCKKVLGPENPSTLSSMNNLALVLESQGKYDEAEQMHRQTLELKEKVLGLENPSTLDSMNNLALVLESQGKYDEAEQMHRQTLELREKVLGPENPSTLTSMNNLAEALRSQGKYDEAEKMHRQALELRQKVLGPENPSTLTSMNNLARVLRYQGKHEETEETHRQALEQRAKHRDMFHVGRSASNYGPSQDHVEWKRPLSFLYTSAHNPREKVMGSANPLRLRTEHTLYASLKVGTDSSSTASVD